MSFKIFTLQFTGKLKPVETIEKQRKILSDDYFEFQKVDASEELKKYLALEKEINSDEFKRKEKEIKALQFKGSKEFNQLKEFLTLQKKRSLKNYFKVAGSAGLEKFKKIKNSEKLAEYYQLLEYVTEGQFDRDKKEIREQVFRGSVEEKHLIDFKKLDKSTEIKVYKELHNSRLLSEHEAFSRSEKLKKYVELGNEPEKDKQKSVELKRLKRDAEIRRYFRFEYSKKLRIYRETTDSEHLKRYNELKAYIESDDFKNREAYLKDKTKFERSEASKRFKRFKQLSSDADVKFYFEFEKSRLYKNYLDVADSFDLKRFQELEQIINSSEFKERRLYLEDNKKWEKTPEFARQQEFLSMKKFPHLVRYFKYKGTTVFRFFEEWEPVFEDNFLKPHLDSEKWSTKSYVAEKMLGDNYSLAGDNYVFTDGKNIRFDGKLKIEVRKERAAGKVWQMPVGFLPVELDYTSGIISSWKSFWADDGILEAKIKFDPVPQVVSSVYLAGEQNMPRVNLLEMGAKNRLGIINIDKGKAIVNGISISNLKKGRWYIFTVEKKGNSFTWKINETEIFSVQSNEMDKKMHINASVIVVSDIPGAKLPVGFEIDWVKFYCRK